MEEMTPKARLLGAIRGEEIDRVPWSPFLAYYWDFVKPEVSKKGQLAFLQDIGADPLMRGEGMLYRIERKNCEHRFEEKGTTRTETFETPVGTLREVYTYTPSSNTWFITKHAVASEEEVKILQYIFENTTVVPNPKDFEEAWTRYGDQALVLPLVSTNGKTAMQSMLERWFGTVELVYGLQDYPEAIEECLAVIRDLDRQTVEISVDSHAEGFTFWEDTSTTNLSPELFSKYVAPEINEWGRIIHQNGKLLIHHACGHLRDLIPIMGEMETDAIESISPPPTGDIEIADAFAKLPANKALIGGIEPTVLLNSSLPDLEQYTQKLLESTQGRRYVLANSDSCPPYVEEEKFRAISRLVRNQALCR